MKTLFVMLILIYGKAHAQSMDTVIVTTDKTVYLLFETDVSIVDLGTKLDYAQQIKENIVMLKALRENVKATSLMIKTKTDIFVWIIKYKKEPPTLRIDTRHPLTQHPNATQPSVVTTASAKPELPVDGATSENVMNVKAKVTQDKYLHIEMPVLIKKRVEVGNRELNVKDEVMQGKIYTLLSDRQNFRDLGEISNGIYFSLHDLAVDKQFLYIKMGLFNTSSIAFDLDVVYFERNQGKSFKKREAYEIMNIPSVFHESVVTVHPSTEEVVVFVLDLFAYQDKDKLMVKVNERGGVRSLQFYIPAKSIVNAKSL